MRFGIDDRYVAVISILLLIVLSCVALIRQAPQDGSNTVKEAEGKDYAAESLRIYREWQNAKDSKNKTDKFKGVFNAWARKDLTSASNFVLQIRDDEPRDSELLSWLLDNIVDRWMRKSPMAAAKWAESLPDGSARYWALSDVVQE